MNITSLDLQGILPLWIISFGVLALLLLEAVGKEAGRRSAPLLTGTFLLASIASVFHILSQRPLPGLLFQGCVVVDLYSTTLMGICLVSGFLCLLFSVSYLERERAVTGEYYVLLLLAVSGMIVLTVSADFLTLFVGMELMSLSSYALAGYLRNRARAIEAAMKYFLAGVFSSGFLLYGIAMFYGVTGSLRFVDLRHALRNGEIPRFDRSGGRTGSGRDLVSRSRRCPSMPGRRMFMTGPRPRFGLAFHGRQDGGCGDLRPGLGGSVSAFRGPGLGFGVLAVLTMTVGNLGALAPDKPQANAGFFQRGPRRIPIGGVVGGCPCSRRPSGKGGGLLSAGLYPHDLRGFRLYRLGLASGRANSPAGKGLN